MENAAVLSIDLNAIDKDGMTAFHLVCQRGYLDVVNIFMENAAALSIDLNAMDKDGMTGYNRYFNT